MEYPPQNFSTHKICTQSWHLPILSMTLSMPQLLPGFPSTSSLPRKVLTLLQSLIKSHLFCEDFPNYLKTMEFPLLLQTQGSLTCLWQTLCLMADPLWHYLSTGIPPRKEPAPRDRHWGLTYITMSPSHSRQSQKTHMFVGCSHGRPGDGGMTPVLTSRPPRPKEKYSNSVWH